MSLGNRIRKAESTLGGIGFDFENYKEAQKKYFRGLDNGEASSKLPPLPKNAPYNFCETTVISLHELEKEARLSGKLFRAKLGMNGPYVDESYPHV